MSPDKYLKVKKHSKDFPFNIRPKSDPFTLDEKLNNFVILTTVFQKLPSLFASRLNYTKIITNLIGDRGLPQPSFRDESLIIEQSNQEYGIIQPHPTPIWLNPGISLRISPEPSNDQLLNNQNECTPPLFGVNESYVWPSHIASKDPFFYLLPWRRWAYPVRRRSL
ncbi:hypothetical protein ACTFIW_008865 [Dictyostelium discoideum]